MPGNKQAVDIEDDAEDNKTVDDNDEEHANENIVPILERVVEQTGNTSPKIGLVCLKEGAIFWKTFMK